MYMHKVYSYICRKGELAMFFSGFGIRWEATKSDIKKR